MKVVTAAVLLGPIMLSAWGGLHTADWPFKVVHGSQAGIAAFRREMDACRSGTRAFADILARIPASSPLAVDIQDSSSSVLFASTYDAETVGPRFAVDLLDLRMLPTADDVRSWASDSSWAFTRCEALAHELTEAIAYRRIWRARPKGEDTKEANNRFGARHRVAHREGLIAEEKVAEEQRTRVDAQGEAHGRTRECFADQSVHIVFGANTETLSFGEWTIRRPNFFPNRDMCTMP